MQMLVCIKAVNLLLAADFRNGKKFLVHTFGILYFAQYAVRQNTVFLYHFVYKVNKIFPRNWRTLKIGTNHSVTSSAKVCIVFVNVILLI